MVILNTEGQSDKNPDDVGSYAINFSGIGDATPGATEYIQPNGELFNGAETLYLVVPDNGSVVAMRALLGTAPAVGETLSITIMLNGGAQAMTFIISDAETTGSTTSNPVTLAAGDRITIRTVASNNGSQATANISVNIKIQTV